MSDLPMITNRALTPPPARPAAGPFRIVQRAMAALTARTDARLAKLEASLNEVREQINAKGRSFIYNSGFHAAFEGRIDFEADTFGVMLLSDRYDPDEMHHRMAGDIMDHEAIGAGYVARRVPVVKSMAQGQIVITLGGAKWDKATIAARYAAYYVERGSDPAKRELFALVDFGRTISTRENRFEVLESTARL